MPAALGRVKQRVVDEFLISCTAVTSPRISVSVLVSVILIPDRYQQYWPIPIPDTGIGLTLPKTLDLARVSRFLLAVGVQGPSCIIVPNFVKIRPFIAEI